jgi:hypothetical protein
LIGFHRLVVVNYAAAGNEGGLGSMALGAATLEDCGQ